MQGNSPFFIVPFELDNHKITHTHLKWKDYNHDLTALDLQFWDRISGTTFVGAIFPKLCCLLK